MRDNYLVLKIDDFCLFFLQKILTERKNPCTLCTISKEWKGFSSQVFSKCSIKLLGNQYIYLENFYENVLGKTYLIVDLLFKFKIRYIE